MGPLYFDHMHAVANIVDEVLLGKDILLHDPSELADIIQSKERMILQGVCIPLKMPKSL